MKLGKLAAIFYNQDLSQNKHLRKVHHELVLECCRCRTFLPFRHNQQASMFDFLKRLRKNYSYLTEVLKSFSHFIEIVFHVSWIKPGFNIAEESLKETWTGHNYIRQRRRIQQEIEEIKDKLNTFPKLEQYTHSASAKKYIEHMIFSETSPDELTGIISLQRKNGKMATLKLEAIFRDFSPSAVKTKIVGPMPAYYMAQNIYQNISQSNKADILPEKDALVGGG